MQKLEEITFCICARSHHKFLCAKCKRVKKKKKTNSVSNKYRTSQKIYFWKT